MNLEIKEKQQQYCSHSHSQASYSRFAAQIEELQKQDKLFPHQIPAPFPIITHQHKCNYQQNLPTHSQQRQLPILYTDHPNIKINYTKSQLKNSNYKVLSSQTKQSELKQQQYYPNRFLPQKNDYNQIQSNELNSIQQNQLEYRWSDDEINDTQRNILESRIVKKITIQSFSNRDKQINKIERKYPAFTVKRSTSAPQHVKNSTTFRPINDSIEYETEERQDFQPMRDRYTTVPNLSEKYGRTQNNMEQMAVISSIETLSKNQGKNKYKYRPIYTNWCYDTFLQKQMLKKIDYLCNIVEELKQKDQKKFRNPQCYHGEKQEISILRGNIKSDLDQIKNRLQSLQSQPLYIHQNHHRDTPSTHSLTKVGQQQGNVPQVNFFKDYSNIQQNISNIQVQKCFESKRINNEGIVGRKCYKVSDLQNILNNKIWDNISGIQQLQNAQKQALLYKILRLFDLNEKVEIFSSNYHLIIAQLLSCKLVIILTSTYCYIGNYQVDSSKHYKQQGFGILVQPHSQVYSGFFENNLKYGQGTVCYRNKSSYSGSWLRSKFNGRGVFISQFGDTYQGNFSNSLKNGQGIQHFANGDKYTGFYQDNHFSGRGIYTWKNGSTYKGMFKNGKIQGKGRWLSFNGDQYNGEYLNNLKEGWGTYKWRNGKIYQGYFHNGKRLKPKKYTEQYRHRQNKKNIIINFINKTEDAEYQSKNVEYSMKSHYRKANSMQKIAVQQKFRIFFNRIQPY